MLYQHLEGDRLGALSDHRASVCAASPAVFYENTFVLTDVKSENRDPPSSSTVPVNLWLGFSSWSLFTALLIPHSTEEATSSWSCLLSHLSRARLFETPWSVACQAPLSMGLSRQEYWSGVALLQGIFPTQGSNGLLCLLHWQADSLSPGHMESL